MSGVEVLSRTQRVIVLPNTSVSLVKQGPEGPAGPQGPPGIQGPNGQDGALLEGFNVLTEDVAHSSEDQGLFLLAVRKDDEGPSTDTDGNYSALLVDANGRLKVTGNFGLDESTLEALENITVVLDAASLSALETINVSNIASTEFPEDSAHSDGAAGSLVLAVRRDEDTSSVSADGDYASLLVDSLGRLKVKQIKDAQIVPGTLTIPNGGSLSNAGGDSGGVVDLTKKSLVGIQMPADWTAAALTFQGSADGGVTFDNLYDDTMVERSIAVVASRVITLDPTKFMGVTHLKFRSGTSSTPVNQAANRIIRYTTVAL